MTHARWASLMGLAMGAMVSAMAHGPLAGAGAVFVSAHLAVLAAAALAVSLMPGIRVRFARHRPSPAVIGRMAFGVAAGFALVCAHCVATSHGDGRPWT